MILMKIIIIRTYIMCPQFAMALIEKYGKELATTHSRLLLLSSHCVYAAGK
jgi:hypothetical protein